MDDQVRYNRDSLVAALRMVGVKDIAGNSCRCPFHDDHSASGWIHQGKDNVWRFTCHAASCGFSGDVYDVQSKGSRIALGEVLKAARRGSQTPSRANYTPTSTTQNGPVSDKRVWPSVESIISSIPLKHQESYRYTNPATGVDDLVVLRFLDENGKKTFRQVHPVSGGWVMESPDKPWPLFNRQGILKSDVVLVVEGEKCAQACIDVGVCATTSPCGAGKASLADWSVLAGKKVVYLWPDNDDGGKKHMQEVEKILLEMGLTVLVANPESAELGPKGDVADYLCTLSSCDAELKAQAIWDVLAEAIQVKPVVLSGPAEEVRQRLSDTVSGKWKAVDWPWLSLSRLTKALLPGTVTLLCGDPGTSKSFYLLQAAAYWYLNKIPVALFELEEDRTYHLYRALAQVTGNSQMLNDSWVRSNQDEAGRLFDEHKDFLDGFGKCIWSAPDKQKSLEEMQDWVEERAKAGCRVIAIDPVTAAVSNDKPWSADKRFILGCKSIAREYQTSVVLVTHPKKGLKAIGMDGMSGGAGYSQFSQTILWLEYHKQIKRVQVPCSMGGTVEEESNRTLHILKARNGCGHGLSLAYMFDGKSTTFHEKGPIQHS